MKWISVKEKLPQCCKREHVVYRNNVEEFIVTDGKSVGIVLWDYDEKEFLSLGIVMFGVGITVTKGITHWMPIPACPTE